MFELRQATLPSMLKNYITIAIRALFKNKLYSFINISGLAVGIAVCVLILMFVAHEYSFDRFHKNGNEIFRAEKQFSRDGRYSLYGNPQFGPELKALDPRVLNYVRLYDRGRTVVKSDDQHKFFEERFLFADTSFFSMFSFPLVKGDRAYLSRPSTVILTESTATKYFGSADPIGRTIIFDDKYSLEVVGVAQNVPSNSSLQFDFVGSIGTLRLMPNERDMMLNNSSGFPTYLLLSSSADLPAVEQSILKTTYTNSAITYSLAPFFENHFNLNFGDTSNTRYVFIFLCVALVILSLALINYMNLTTARATSRAKEVGIRKVIGALQKTLSWQFYIESALTTSVAFVLALVLVQLAKPVFFEILQQQIDATFLTSPFFIGIVIVLVVVCILLSGSYPALVLPRFKPVDVLNAKFGRYGQRAWLRKSLIVFQFAASVGLAICTLVMTRQLNFLNSKSIGLQREQVIVIPIDQLPSDSYHTLKTELRQQSGILSVSAASISLYKTSMSGVSLVTSPVSNEKVGTKWIMADEEFIRTLGISWVEISQGDKLVGNHIINETAVKSFGMTAAHTGFTLNAGDQDTAKGKIVGVVEDFNYESLRTRIEPMIVTIVGDTSIISGSGTLYVRIDPKAMLDDKLAAVKKIYERHVSDTPFSYYFLDDSFNELHKGEQRLSKIFGVFTLIALGIACLGLFGLITYMAERRTKEVSIRKVLGASIQSILTLLSKELIIVLLVSICIGAPLAWLAMEDWLNHFFYKATIPISVVVFPAVALVVISLVIICGQAFKVAMNIPAANLKNE